MVNEKLREYLSEQGYESLILFDNASYDNSLIGVSGISAVYDYDKMVDELMKDEGWDDETAMEWIDYNALGSITGGRIGYPIVCRENEDGVLVNCITDEPVEFTLNIDIEKFIEQ